MRAAKVLVAAALAAAGIAWFASASPGRAAPGSVAAAPLKAAGSDRVLLDAVLRDARGSPLPGATVRLTATVRFFGRDREAILDRGRTDWKGRVTLRFVPRDAGVTKAVVRFDESAGYRSAESPVSFDVGGPIEGYRQAPVGISAPYAHAGLVLIPLAAVWLTYVHVGRLAHRITRPGLQGGPAATTTGGGARSSESIERSRTGRSARQGGG